MGKKLQSSRRLRPVDLARGHGLSTQAVRNYEAAGILPTADRTPHGHRTYTRRHEQALGTFLALLPGHGHPTATSIMRAVHRDAVEEAYHLIDESHAQLLDDRRTLQAVERALRDLAPAATAADGRAPARRTGTGQGPGAADVFVGALAAELGIRPATLRTWERAGLVRPRRDARTGYRVYDEAAVRDARLTHQLRRGGHLLAQIGPLIEQVRTAGGPEPLAATLRDWHARLTARGLALLTGAAELAAYLRERDGDRDQGEDRERECGRG
ncbi:TioE family transcriptional regulator [Streptomyces sp. NPDC002564]|uniref:TioE family transcriptional regulator n=1 Tax=Streptomyces sp. NPDC002564 TaxID=3364649 RepID=UPI0036B5F810